MRVLITGGTGFIGRNLVEQLSGKYEIINPSHRELELIEEQATYDFLKKNSFDVVLHTATWNAARNSPKDLSKVLAYNLKMFFNLVRGRDFYGKMINYGSGAEYDRRYYIPRMPESYFDAHVPVDDYGFSKYIISKYIEKVDNIYNLRLFGVFGKYEDWGIRFISNACCKAVRDLPITMKQNIFFDYLFIDDLVKITEWFIENEPRKKTYNICTGRSYDLLTLAEKVIAVSGKKLEIKIARPGLGREYSGDNHRLLYEIGNYAFSDLDECIRGLYDWYLAGKNALSVERLLIDK